MNDNIEQMPNYKPGFANWTAIEALDDFEQVIDNDLANATLVIGDVPVAFSVLQVASLNRCMGDDAIAMTRVKSSLALVDEFLKLRKQLAAIEQLLNDIPMTRRTLTVQKLIQQIHAILWDKGGDQ